MSSSISPPCNELCQGCFINTAGTWMDVLIGSRSKEPRIANKGARMAAPSPLKLCLLLFATSRTDAQPTQLDQLPSVVPSDIMSAVRKTKTMRLWRSLLSPCVLISHLQAPW